ncbi:uncharacterized protein TRAVEDRAFT_53880 [Trametes versicolor FP-101664 SS1]|uniref:uncharacterized protein n=1 Tax=Trametes versicolor (strain FP-101664) TaxID=717944 RepID=UPI0004622200|nr:uncharacterized protein TRAVEDRAFT_53880 [Trametes versicolor FP-101664 SS1]EIW52459.1 hypothetical protein TRAVEDRAFT_53880 [Trametes versicolor FP-101664 SS1]
MWRHQEEPHAGDPYHLPGEVYRCNYENCTYAGTQSNAKQHFMSVHTTERLYVCVHQTPGEATTQCGRSYASLKELWCHQEKAKHPRENDLDIYTRMQTAAKAHMRDFYPNMVLGPKDDQQCGPYRGALGPSTPTPRIAWGHKPRRHPDTTLPAFQPRPYPFSLSAAAAAAPPPFSPPDAVMNERASSPDYSSEGKQVFAPFPYEQEYTQFPRHEGLSGGDSAQHTRNAPSPPPPYPAPAQMQSQFTLRPARF